MGCSAQSGNVTSGRKVDFLGIRVDRLSRDELLNTLRDWGLTGRGRKAYNVNAHAMNLAYRDDAFAVSLNSADLVFCDGFGVKWGMGLLGVGPTDRLTPPDWIDEYLGQLSTDRVSIFLLGDELRVVEDCRELMLRRHPDLRVAGALSGFFDEDEESAIRLAVEESGAGVVLVGMGMPRQELFCDRASAESNVRLWIPVGALFRWYAGAETRAPRWITDHGWEWLSRFLSHPVRHFRRYALGNPRFAGRLLLEKLRTRSQSGS